MLYTIMVVDDEIIEREYIKSIVLKYPNRYCLVGEANNGKQAINIALDKGPDVIIMDISMPLLDGLESSRLIKLEYENSIIILNSAYSEFEFAQKAISYGLDAYLLKPASENEIIDTIESSLRKAKYQSRGIMISNEKENIDIREYPYNLVDNIVSSIEVKDIDMLEKSVEDLLKRLKALAIDADKYRLFIINTIFTIMRTLNNIMDDNVSNTFRSEEYLERVSRASYWHEIYSLIEEFLSNVIALLRNSYQYTNNFTLLVEKYIEENYDKKLTLDKLSDVFHFSPAYLSRKFHQEKGCTINDYIRNTRIRHAIILIESSSLSIKHIAIKSGFSNVSHFNRVFKSVTGSTPSDYKAKGVN